MVAGLACAGALLWRKNVADVDSRRHDEVMVRVNALQDSVAPAAAQAESISGRVDKHCRALLHLLSRDAAEQDKAYRFLLNQRFMSDHSRLLEIKDVQTRLGGDVVLIDRLLAEKSGAGAKDSNHKDSNHKDSNHKDSNHKDSNQKESNEKVSNDKVSSYPDFKALLYHKIDPRFISYFNSGPDNKELHSIRWNGHYPEEKPPLTNPSFNGIADSAYLKDDDIIYVIPAKKLALPQRVLNFHDIVEVPGIVFSYDSSQALCYAFDPVFQGRSLELRNSAVQIGDDHLLFDHATESLWLPTSGRAVTGNYAGSKSILTPLPVVTCSWKECRRKYPDVRVLSRQTGHDRDY